MAIPTIHQCYSLMDEYAMLANIRAHSLMVARVAALLVQKLAGPSRPLPQDLVLAGALLHDIAKTPCLEGRCDHARHGSAICHQHGYPEVAELIQEHVMLKEFSPKRYSKGLFFPKELVFYADKRVRHDQIVSLGERLDYILGHYGRDDPQIRRQIRQNFAKCLELEKFIFTFMDITVADVSLAAAAIRFP